MNPEVNIDHVDAIILNILLREARTSLKEIAKECNISTVAVFKRIKRLKKEGLILGTSMSVNPSELGFKIMMGLGFRVSASEEQKIFEFLEKQPNVLSVVQSFGSADIIVLIGGKDNFDLEKTIYAIKNRPGVKGLKYNGPVGEFIFLPENLNIQATGEE